MMVRRRISELIDEGAIVEMQDGNHGEKHPTSKDYVDEGIPFLMARDFKGSEVDLQNACKISKKLADSLRIGFARSGDVLLTHKGTIGSVAIVPNVPDYVMLTPQVTYYRTNPSQLLNKYLKYAFQTPHFRHQLDSYSAQSTRPYIGITAQRQLEIDYPPLPVQRRIAGILSAYDELIENNQRRIKILEEMARSLYREWFVLFRFPGHDKVKLVSSTLGPIPQGWEVLPLETVCERITDGAHHSPKSVEGGFPMASVKDMRDWGFNLESCRQISQEDYKSLVRNDCRPKKGDILIAKDGSYLKHTFVVGKEQELVILSSIAMLRPNERIYSNYLNFILRSVETKARMKGFVSGVALPRIILKDFRNFQIIVAPHGLQAKWSKYVDPMVESCRHLTAMNETLRRTRDLLLPRLLSGQIDPHNTGSFA